MAAVRPMIVRVGELFLKNRTSRRPASMGRVKEMSMIDMLFKAKRWLLKGLKDLGAVGGEAVDGDVGDPGDKDKPGRLPLGHASFPVNFC